GRHHVYALRAVPVTPDFELKVDTDRLTVIPGKPLEVSVTVNRLEGFADEIEISVVGLPDGVTAAPVKAPAAAKTAKIAVQAIAGAASGSIQIAGQAGSPPRRRLASAPVADLGVTTGHLWLAV